jgi:hypothetical protein
MYGAMVEEEPGNLTRRYVLFWLVCMLVGSLLGLALGSQ